MDYRTQLKPYAHQVQALAALKGKREFALLMAMRTGKTKVTLDDFGRLLGETDDFLLVAPAAVYETWVEQIHQHFDLSILPRCRVHVWRAKDKRHPDEFMEYRGGPRFLLVNVEALSLVDRAKKLCLEFARQRRCYAVVDESTTIKNRRAKRTKFLTKELAPLAKFRRILSGLPTPRSPLDIWSQLQFLGPKLLPFASYTAFEQRYAITKLLPINGRYISVVVGYRRVDELAEQVAPHAFRCRLEDCYDLPPKIYERRDVPLDDEQRRIYQAIKKDAMAQLSAEAHVTATHVVVQMLRLHQVLCGHVVDELGVLHSVPEKKTDVLMGLLEELSGKVIVWCSYDYSIQDLTATLEGEHGAGSVARFWGGNKDVREGEERRFKEDPACRFMLATPAAGGRGREWSCADAVVYFSSTPDLEHRSQSEERVQIVGKSRSVLYVDLIARGTVEEKILKALREKIDLAAAITGDTYQDWLI